MITIKAVPVSRDESHRLDFYKSIPANSAIPGSHEVIALEEAPSLQSRIVIYLPDDCLVLGASWDKYIVYALDNGLPKGDPKRPETWITWAQYVKNKMGLVDRNGSGIFPDLRVDPVALDINAV